MTSRLIMAKASPSPSRAQLRCPARLAGPEQHEVPRVFCPFRPGRQPARPAEGALPVELRVRHLRRQQAEVQVPFQLEPGGEPDQVAQPLERVAALRGPPPWRQEAAEVGELQRPEAKPEALLPLQDARARDRTPAEPGGIGLDAEPAAQGPG